jgi:hypothetical protein
LLESVVPLLAYQTGAAGEQGLGSDRVAPAAACSNIAHPVLTGYALAAELAMDTVEAMDIVDMHHP